MKGKVVSGRKEGIFFTSIYEYKEQFKEKLGILPFPGTLNFVSEVDLNGIDGIIINGFVKNNVSYGSVTSFPVKIGKMNGAILIPDKRHHNHLEIISECNLRKKLNLRDGDEIKLKFVPFIKRRRKYILRCDEGYKRKAKIKIYYDSPLIKNPLMESCNEGQGCKIIPSRMVASMIFEKNAKKSYEKFIKWVKERYSILSPPILIEHNPLKEWQIEVKLNNY